MTGAGRCNPAPDSENEEFPDPRNGAEYIASVSPGRIVIGIVLLYNAKLDGTRDTVTSDVAPTGLPLESCNCMTKILLPTPLRVRASVGATYRPA